jgi:hypothetical protein
MAGLTIAIFAAPFLALLYGLASGLVVMAAGLVAASYLLRNAGATTWLTARGWLRAALIVNLTLAFACLLAAVWLIFGR